MYDRVSLLFRFLNSVNPKTLLLKIQAVWFVIGKQPLPLSPDLMEVEMWEHYSYKLPRASSSHQDTKPTPDQTPSWGIHRPILTSTGLHISLDLHTKKMSVLTHI